MLKQYMTCTINDENRISAALLLLFSVITSITFAADVEFRNSSYFKVIWVTVVQMLMIWFIATLAPDWTTKVVDILFLILFALFMYVCLIPITLHVWLSANFRHNYTCFVRKRKVLIPHDYANLIKNDKQYGYKYELISSEKFRNDNYNDEISDCKQKMDQYWKFKTNKLYIIKCFKTRNATNSIQNARLYVSTFASITMIYAIWHGIAYLIVFSFPNLKIYIYFKFFLGL